jgi:hypothetical protein
MLLGSGFAFTFMGIANAKFNEEARLNLTLKLRPLSIMGHIGLALLVASGSYLGSPFWEYMDNMPFFSAKLTLVVLLAVLIIAISILVKWLSVGKVRLLKTVEWLSKLAFVTSIGIIVLAVMTFH